MSDGRFQKQTQLISDISYAYTECYADCQFIHLFILEVIARLAMSLRGVWRIKQPLRGCFMLVHWNLSNPIPV